jgi:hypothetical protein
VIFGTITVAFPTCIQKAMRGHNITFWNKFSTLIRLQIVFKRDIKPTYTATVNSRQHTNYFNPLVLIGIIMFSLLLLCKNNASHIQNDPCKYSLNWKPYRHKEMECLPFLVVTTNVWYCILILLRYFIQRNFKATIFTLAERTQNSGGETTSCRRIQLIANMHLIDVYSRQRLYIHSIGTCAAEISYWHALL